MAKKVLIELYQEDGLEFPVNHASEREREIVVFDLKRYDRDGLGLPPVFVLSESKDNKSLNVSIAFDKVSDGLKTGMFIEDENFICFYITNERGVERVKHAKASIEMTPEHQTIKTKTSAQVGDIEKELSKGMASSIAKDDKLDLKNESVPSLDNVFFNKKR